MAFVKEAEALIERGQAERLRGEEGMRKRCNSVGLVVKGGAAEIVQGIR